jgi:DNA mismatch repair protein MLH1
MQEGSFPSFSVTQFMLPREKQAGSPSPDLSTPSSSSTPQAIRLLYGHSITKNLLHIKLSSVDKSKQNETGDTDGGIGNDENNDDAESWTAESHFTNVNYHAKKMIFLLFINRTSFTASDMTLPHKSL